MSGKQISLIYFYLVSAASLALIVVGIFNTVNFLANNFFYDEYPLRYQIVDCRGNYPYKGPAPVPGGADFFPATPSAAEQQESQKNCEEQLALQRKQQKVDDIKSAVTFSLVGVILFGLHFTQARKHSKS